MPARDPRAAARLSGPLPSAAGGRAEGPRRGPWPGPQPARRKPLGKLPLSLVSQRGEPRRAKSTSKKTSRATPKTLGGDAAPEADGRAGRSSAVGSSRPERGLAGSRRPFCPGLGPRLASRPRQGQSGQHPDPNTHPPGTSGSGTARSPRLPNGRNGNSKKDWKRVEGPGSEREAQSAPLRARPAAPPPPPRLWTADASLSRAGGWGAGGAGAWSLRASTR